MKVNYKTLKKFITLSVTQCIEYDLDDLHVLSGVDMETLEDYAHAIEYGEWYTEKEVAKMIKT